MSRICCRGCNKPNLSLIHDFGQQPLAGDFPQTPEGSLKAKRYALDLSYCNFCSLLQVTNLPPIADIFHEDYRYSTSTIPSLVKHFEDYSNFIEKLLPPAANILEFGCNDGTLLKFLSEKGFKCLGVDASANIVKIAQARGLNVKHGFFNPEFVKNEHIEGKYNLITCSNVFAHIDDIISISSAVKHALKPNGLFLIEVHDADNLITGNQFDTIYHEHLTYFSKISIRTHLEANGFLVESITCTPMHGGSLRVLARRSDEVISTELIDSINVEFSVSATRLITNSIDESHLAVCEIRKKYGKLTGYGAAGRSQMFINFTRTSHQFLKIFDDSPLRQNRYISGTEIPIIEFQNVYQGGACIILAWNYADYIAPRIANYFDAIYTVLPVVKKWA